jgi:hypothetical protein
MSNKIPIPAFSSADATAPDFERYCKKIRREVKLYGFEKALERWRVVCDYMQDEDWWPAVVRKVEETIDEIIEEMNAAKKAELDRQAELQKESKPSLVVFNKSTGIEQVDQLNGIIEKDAEVTHTKQN